MGRFRWVQVGRQLGKLRQLVLQVKCDVLYVGHQLVRIEVQEGGRIMRIVGTSVVGWLHGLEIGRPGLDLLGGQDGL